MATGGTSGQSDSDARLISQILAGEPDLYQEIVRKYQRMVASVAYKMGVRQDDMEDLVSEVFIKAYRNLSLYRPDHAFSTWLYRLATNRVLDALRSRRRSLKTDPLDERVVAGGEPADQMLQDRDRAQVVTRALERLPEEYRAPIVLLHLEERKVSEIALTLGIPEGTVKTRLARGRARLKKILEQDFPEYSA